VSTGPAQIQTTNNGLTSAAVTVNVDPLAPAFFTIGTNATSGNIYIAAEHANGTLIGPAATIKALRQPNQARPSCCSPPASDQRSLQAKCSP
jgi:uncharacterized protein (TIGR03437 family)